VDWDQVSGSGIAFALVKATEGTYYTSPTFSQQYDGSYGAGLIRGSYHFAIPDDSSGAAQAVYFVSNGGGWSDDGQTLPGVLDIEWNPYSGNDCYDMSKSELESWILEFSDTYLDLTGRPPMIYTAASWWSQCVDSDLFGATNPLWVAHYGAVSPNIPVGWDTYDLWQYSSTGSVPGVTGDCDVNVWNGTWRTLQDFAAGP
jgi:GH25 family lysozyme M1 (1,4-beta-N-acetylmuramidase)